MNIALIGPSGVGKGTQAAQLIDRFGLMPLATGQLLRQNLEQRRAVGLLAQRYLTKGELVPDEVVDAMVAEWLWHIEPSRGALFDGFPRTIEQAQFLDNIFVEVGRELDTVIYLKMSDDAVEKRLAGRIVCSRCQTPFHQDFKPPGKSGVCDACGSELIAWPDDIQQMVRVRLRAFRRVLGPVLDYYTNTDRLITIDGDRSLEEVGKSVLQAIEKIRLDEPTQTASAEEKSVEASHEYVNMLLPDEVTHQSVDLVLIGGPGSGKGTQAEQLQSHLNLPHIATGDLFRDNLKNKTSLGELAKSFMNRGALVPDDVTEAMVEDRLAQSDADPGFILDGFPRTLQQTYALTEIMNAAGRRINQVIYIRVSDEEIVRRLSGRLICRECQTPYHVDFKPPQQPGVCDNCSGELYQRDDDNPKTVRARLKTFHSQTGPILSYYRDAGVLTGIDGEGEVSDVVQRTIEASDAARLKA